MKVPLSSRPLRVKRLPDFNTKGPNFTRRWGRRFLIVVCFSLIAGCRGYRSTTAPIRNGDLTRGTDSPEYWQSNPGLPGTSFLRWHHNVGGPGELEIDNVKPNDSHWTQIVHLNPGWYLFTASVRAEGVRADRAGANLSSLEDGIISTPISGTTGWQTLGFYLKVGKAGADLPIACRLGGYSSPNTGKAFFRNITGTRVDTPSQDNLPRYDLDTIRGIGLPPPKEDTAPRPTHGAIVQPISKPSPTELPVSKVEHENETPASRDDILIERSIDFLELAMTIVLVLATLYAAARMLGHRLLRQQSHPINRDLPNPMPSEPFEPEVSSEARDKDNIE